MVAEMPFLHEKKGMLTDVFADRIDNKLFLIQKTMQRPLFFLISQALHQLHLSHNRNVTALHVRYHLSGMFVPAHMPDEDIRINKHRLKLATLPQFLNIFIYIHILPVCPNAKQSVVSIDAACICFIYGRKTGNGLAPHADIHRVPARGLFKIVT